MIFGQLPGQSPQRRTNRDWNNNQTGLAHLTCHQLGKVTIKWDDIVLDEAVISRVIIIGQRGMAQIVLTIKDSTGHSKVAFYYDEQVERLASEKGNYVKVAMAVKVGGLAYRPQIKRTGISISPVTDFNELTLHYLQCIKRQVKAPF